MPMMDICRYDAPLIVGALKARLKDVEADLALLRISLERDLTPDERGELPSTLQELSQERLQENVDPWYSLKRQYECLIEEFELASY